MLQGLVTLTIHFMAKKDTNNKNKLVLIDGNSLLYRAFFALPPTLATSSGVITNAVYGFVSMLIKLIELEKPYGIAVAWDKGKPHRLEQYEEYKAHRKPAAHELVGQFPVAREVLGALNIPGFELEGFEADDILATMAVEAEKEGFEIVIVTGDRDAFQLISDNIKVMTTRKGITDIVVYDKDRLFERYGISPSRITDMLGLKGDPSDNIPGVPGIGEKTAVNLVQQFGSIDNIYKNIDKVTPTRAKNALEKNKEMAFLSKKLAVLLKDLPLDVDYGTLQWQGPDEQNVRQVFNSLEFRTLAERLFKVIKAEKPQEAEEIVYEEVDSSWLQLRLSGVQAAFYIDSGLDLIAANDGQKTYISKGPHSSEQVLATLSATRKAIFNDAKNIMRRLKVHDSGAIGSIFDIALAAYINDPSIGAYRLQSLSSSYLGRELPEDLDPDKYAALSAKLSFELYQLLSNKLSESGLSKLYEELELPLVDVLMHMERRGIMVDVAFLRNLSLAMGDSIRSLTDEIYELAGGEFNINSTQQLSEVLFEKLGLKPLKKTKTGISTSASTLTAMIEDHPIIKLVLQYRELTKLKGTYVDSMPELADKRTNRLHTTFHQTVTATGRLSSSDPNIQNIPIRSALGREIRKAFIAPEEEDCLLIADYSQIELRILAHVSNDPTLVAAFESGEDIHRKTASEVFNVPLDEVTKEMRRNAKAVNFGIVYGISARGLAEQLGVLPEQAKEYIDKYFERYPGVKRYMETAVETAYKQGYVTTLLNRRRYIPELKSSNFRVRSFGERLAINTPIQGTAADIIKVAMLDIHKMLHEKQAKTEMVLQVHDELVFELCNNEEFLIRMIENKMVDAFKLRPKLELNLSFGKNWNDLAPVN